ncbi:anti-sigma factor [Flavilitoribacter nigricans]|uniref:Anti-sigma K factor RskA C-terminal domain-containing protein n=1 Tax=Flavilitoribacter nigricans (strain ATCC 23147 / DSM 23189 / NBRC 102662 / NCIMB 1420 / SS-2) TaxID=1122177 RepID=A0A2D0N9B4_FLAN2|nr:anti-sigma factor [Flavilitoribacter nigricans]PHN05075.1 hypothetical protein CRP01_18800 [Flavilitoribacter nigricans DSM 23189 = NBRC 102662]
MDKERFLQSGLLEQYVLGLTTEEENEEVERYAHAFPEIQSEIDLLRNAVRQYAEEQIATPKINHHPYLSASPTAQEDEEDFFTEKSAPAMSQWIMAIFLVLFAAFGFYYFSQAQRSQERLSQLNKNFIAFKNDCQKEQESLQELQQQVAFYENNLTSPLQLEGTSLAPDSEVRVFWNEQEQLAVVQVFSLPDHPVSKQYQIWADIAGTMVNLGMIDAHNTEPQIIRCLPKASSLNITLEPVGGSKVPHVDQLYANVSLP